MFNNSIDLSKFVRISVVKMTSYGKSSHVGSCLSIADILSVIYMDYIKITSDKKDRDIFLSLIHI